MTWDASLPEGNEAAKIAHLIVPYTRGMGLDVGCGKAKAWPHFIGVDSGRDYGGARVCEIHAGGESLPMFADSKLDFIFSSHLLEHLKAPDDALAEWWRVIRPGGYLVLYLPHKRYYPAMGEPGANPDHKHDFLPEHIHNIMEDVSAASGHGFKLIEDEIRSGGNEYSFFQVYQKTTTPECVYSPYRRPDKALLIIRYGAFGDQLQASSILPWLKAQGWHITYQTTPRGFEVIKHDPHIDAFWVQDTNQVPNEELGPYWESLRERFDWVINLSEVVEGTLLAIPGRIQWSWDQATRHRLMNVNYLERHADMAGVPYSKLKPQFFQSVEEVAWAQRERNAMPSGKILVWCLAGSSHHKMYPLVDWVISWLMKHTDVSVVMVGGPMEKELENAVLEKVHSDAGTLASNRLYRTSGRWTIRQTLAFATLQADCVVGPETGVLNAVAFLSIPKVVMLSHSSHENLTKGWVRTKVLTGNVECYPCHQMHYNHDACPLVEGAGSACSLAIHPRTVFESIKTAMGLHEIKAA